MLHHTLGEDEVKAQPKQWVAFDYDKPYPTSHKDNSNVTSALLP